MLNAGDPAPDVSAPNQHGETVTPDFATPTVVYFYPRDDTPGCTIEAREFRDALPAFEDAAVTVYGVSMDDVESHAEFAAAEDLTFDLLADPDGAVATAFGLDTSGGYTERYTFLLADGEVRECYDPANVDPSGHAEAVLADARTAATQDD